MERRLEQRPIGAGAVLIVVTAFAWLLTARSSSSMDLSALAFLGAWTAMMTAMMLPSAAPLLLGLEHGLWCAGCCWALMLILVAVGSMSLAWAAAMAAVVLVEKVASSGDASPG